VWHLLRRHGRRARLLGLVLPRGRARLEGSRARLVGGGLLDDCRLGLAGEAAREERGHRVGAHARHLEGGRILEQLAEALEPELRRLGQAGTLGADAGVEHEERDERREGA